MGALKALENMLNFYEKTGLIMASRPLKYLAELDSFRCIEWALQMTEPHLKPFYGEEGIVDSLEQIRSCTQNPLKTQYQQIGQGAWKN